MNYFICVIFYFVCQPFFAQESSDLNSYTFKIETIKTSGDSCFISCEQFTKGTLTLSEESIIIKGQTCHILHGNASYWFDNGKKKAEGRYIFGIKKGIWFYWDVDGTLTQDVDSFSDGYLQTRHNTRALYYYIDGVKTRIRE
ncbi:MAG: hypothetical protein ACI865_003178 [Flavobacteriaceae bacterium]|jgi:hypothetical protein